MRLRGTSTEEMEEEGLDTDGAVTSQSKLRSKVKGLAGIDILTETGEYKSTYQILSDIAAVWEDMNDMDQAALLELLAGKRAGSVMAAILQNPDTLKDAFESANNATGSALEENEKYLDSIQGRMDLLTNSLQTMWKNTLDDDLIKSFVDLGNGIIKVIDWIGLIPTALAVAAVALKIYTKRSWPEFFASIGTSVTGLNTKLTSLATRFGLVSAASQTTSTAMNNLSVDMFKQTLTAQGVSDANQKVLLSQMGLTNANATQKISQDALTASTLETAVVQGTLTAEDAIAIATKYGLKVAIAEVNKEQLLQILTTSGVSNSQAENIVTALGLTATTKALTREEFMNALAAAGVKDANTQAALSAILFGEANKKLNWSFKSLGKGIKNFVSKNGALLTITAIVGIIAGAIALINSMTETMEESKEAFTELKSDLEATESELKDMESQLKEVKDQIEEIQSLGSLSFTDQKELERLKEQSNELQRQIDLSETLRNQQQKALNEQALDTAKMYEDIGKTTGKTTEENAGTGAAWGAGVAGAAGAGIGAVTLGAKFASIGAIAGTGIPGLGNAIGAIVGGLIGVIAGAALGAAGGAIVGTTEEKVGDSLDNMKSQYDKLEAEVEKTKAAYSKNASKENKEEYEEAKEALESYKATMSEDLMRLDAKYSTIDLSVYDPIEDAEKLAELRQEINDFYDTQDKWAIQSKSKNAKTNALNRMFGENADEELKNIKAKIEDAAATGNDFQLKDILSDEEYQKLLTRLHSMEMGAGDVTAYFRDMYREEVDAMNDTSTESAVQEVANLTKGIKSLKEAFNEIRTEGQMTVETLLDLKDVFGKTDGWDDFITTMSTGTATMEQMTDAAKTLAENYVNNQISPENWNIDDRLTYIFYLKSLGVQNPEEFLDAKLEQAAADAYINGIYETIEEAEKAYGIDVSDDVVDAAKNKKEAEDKVNTTKENLDAYNAQKIAQDNAKSNNDLYENSLKILENYGFDEELLKRYKEAGNTRADVEAMNLNMADFMEMPQEFKDLYEKATTEWESNGDSEAFKKYIATLQEKYGLLIDEGEKISAIDYEMAWYNSTSMPQQFYDAYEQFFNLEKMEIPSITVPVTTEADMDAVTDDANKIFDEYQAIMDNNGLELDIRLIDPNDLIDDLQNVYDTLTSAAKEYSENGGYVAVDTLQTLLGLDAKYIGLLYDEQGQLNLNTESIQRLTQARIMEMAIIQAKNYLTDLNNAALAGNTSQLTALTTATDLATDSSWNFVDSQLAQIRNNMILKGISDEQADQYVANAKHNIDSIRRLAESTSENIKNTISSSGNNAKDLANDAFQKTMDYWENRIGANQAKYDQIQNEIDMLEKQGKRAGEEYYKEQIKLEEERRQLLEGQKAAALAYMNTQKEGSEEWWDAAQTVNDLESELDDVTSSIFDLNEAISQISWDNLTEINDRYSSLHDELSDIRDILQADKMFDDEGNWAEAGVGYLGSLVQDIGIYKEQYAQVNEELSKLQSEYAGNEAYYTKLGINSEQELYDKKEEFAELQREIVKGLEDAAGETVDLYGEQVDAIEDYTNKLVDSYNDYIDVVKSALEAERD